MISKPRPALTGHKEENVGTYYVTKWALTRGIIEVEGDPDLESTRPMLTVKRGGYPLYFHHSDWYGGKEQAEERVREMIVKRRRALAKMIAKLDSQKILEVTRWN